MTDAAPWVGTCVGCGQHWELTEDPCHGDHEENFHGQCAGCGAVVHFVKITQIGLADMIILEPGPGLCRKCATEHDSHLPHNRESLHYQYWFRQNEAHNGRPERWPTWHDAMAHCTSEIQDMWSAALAEHGVRIDAPAEADPRTPHESTTP